MRFPCPIFGAFIDFSEQVETCFPRTDSCMFVEIKTEENLSRIGPESVLRPSLD